MNISRRAKALTSEILTIALVASLIPAPALAEALEELELTSDEPIELVGDVQEIGVGAVGGQVESAEDAVASVTDPESTTVTYYDSLDDALAEAPSGSTVKLLADAPLVSAVGLADTTLTLDLGSNTLTITKSKGLTVSLGATLAITNGFVQDGSSVLVNNILYADGGTINLDNVKMSCSNATAVRAENGGRVDVSDSTLALWSRTRSTAIASGTNSEIVVREGSTIRSDYSCAAKATDGGTLTVYGGTLQCEDASSSSRSAVEVQSGSKLLMSGGEIVCGDGALENVGSSRALVVNGTAAISGGTLIGSTALYASGLSAEATVTGGFFGGEISTWLFASVDVSGGWFTSQVADKYVHVDMYSSDALLDEAPDANYPYTVLSRTNISDAKVTVSRDFVYNGEQQAPEPSDITVTLDGEPLDPDTDYTLDIEDGAVNAGNYSIYAYGAGTHSGYASGYFTINPIDITEAEFEPIADRTFDGGEEILLELTMVDPAFTLAEDEDFTAIYDGADRIGTANVTVTGTGNFSGTQTVTFEILAPDKSGLEALVAQITPKVNEYAISDNNGFDLTPGTQYVSGKTQSALQAALDDAGEILADENATKTAIADTIAELERAYARFVHSVKTAEQAVAINTRTTTLYASLAEALGAAQSGDTIALTSDTQVASAIVVSGKDLTIDLDEHLLAIAASEGLTASDAATLTIKNGTIDEAGSKTNKLIVASKGTVVLKDVEAYTGYATILVAEKGGSATIEDSILSCGNDDNATVISTDTGSKVVVNGEESAVMGNTIALRAVKNAQVEVNDGLIDARQAICVKGASSYASVAGGRLSGELAIYNKGAIEVSGGWFSEKVPDNCVVVGMYATDALEEQAPDADFPYTVRNCTDISNAIVDVATSFVYNGEEQAPSSTDITVKFAGSPLDPETDYELSVEWPSIDAGTYDVSVEGTGAYTGEAHGTFVIAPLDISEAEFEAVADKPFNGEAVTLGTLTMVEPALTLSEGVDFDANYENNDRVGQASASVEGKGNFKGSATVTFDIVHPDKTELAEFIRVVQNMEIVEATSDKGGFDLPVGTKYTSSEAKQALEDALAAAIEVNEDEEATADQVAEADDALTDAIWNYLDALGEAELGVAANERLGMRYTTLAEAVAEAEAGDTITLLDGATVLKQVAIDKSITLDLNGKSFMSASTLPALSIAGEGVEVAIDDLSVADGGEAGKIWSVADAAAVVSDGAKLTIKGGRFVGTGTVVDVEGGTLAVEGGSFSLLVDLSGLLSNKLLSADTDSYQDGDIVVTGGQFKNFDPSDNSGAGKHSDFTPLGYASTPVEDTQNWWTVVAQEVVAIPEGKTLTYNGEEQVGVLYDDAETDRYTVEDNMATTVGDYEATATLVDAKSFIWKNADDELIADSTVQIAWRIEKAPATNVTVEATSPLYAESEPLSIETAIKSVRIGDTELPETDYEIELVDVDKPGTAKAIITGKDNVEGTAEVTFEVLPAPDKGDLRRSNSEAAQLLDKLNNAKTYTNESELPNPIDGLYVGADALRELNKATKQADEVMADPQASPEAIEAADKRIESAIKSVEDSIRNIDRWERIWGQNGYDTMSAIVKTGFTAQNTSTVVIASRANWQDPLAATALAGTYNAPLLLVGKASESLPRQTKDEIARLKPAKVIVIGGTDVVSANTFNAIKSAAGSKATVTRVAGGSYIARANNMLNQTNQWRGSTAIVATQNSFRDSLSVAPVAYAQKFPIVYVGKKISNAEGGKLDSSTVSLLKSKKIKHIIIVGGELAVSPQVEKQLKGMTIERWFGQNSLDTSAQIAQNAMGLYGMTASYASVARSDGNNYVDALAGAALTGSLNSILVLVNSKQKIGTGTKAFDTVSRRIKGNLNHGYVYGGELAISEEYMNYIRKVQ